MKKISTNPKHAVIYDRIFNQQVDVFINYTPEMYSKWLNRKKIKDDTEKNLSDFAGWTSNYEDYDGRTKSILFIPKFNWSIKSQGTLIHEIVHVIIKIWGRNNIPYNYDTQEFFAHSIGNMYEDIAEKLLV
jgi:hypothetical protein